MAKISWREGVLIETKDASIFLDPLTKKDKKFYNFITHAHEDHLKGLESDTTTYMTSITNDIIQMKRGFGRYKTINYNNILRIDDLEIKIHNAGHIPGSVQFEIKTPESNIVYTGDINCRDMLTTKRAEYIKCDVLILETTYGVPSYIFPEINKIYSDMIKWTAEQIKQKKMPIFKVYSTGKAQEIIKIMNTFTNIPVVTHSTISEINKAYVKNGINLTYIDGESDDGGELIDKQQCIYITPTYPIHESLSFEKQSLAIATGWALRFKNSKVNAAFPLSNHADFNQLFNYVKKVMPDVLYTIHGFDKNFANYVKKKLGIKASPLG